MMNKLLWFGLAVVVGLYGLLLAYTLWKERRARPGVEPASLVAPAASEEAPQQDPASTTSPKPIKDDIAVWKKALALAKEGSALMDGGTFTPASERINQALELAPDLTAAHRERARLMERKQDYASAETEWRSMLAHDPENQTARLRLAAVFLAGGQPANALDLARWAIEADPYSKEGHEIAAAALTALQQPQDAVIHLRRLVTFNRDDLVMQNNLGAALLAAGDYRSALNTFREILRADPGNSVAFYNMAVIHARQTNAAAAVETLMQAARKFGASFVLAWTQSADFDPIRQEAAFRRFVDQGAETPAVSSTDPASDGAAAEQPSAP